jgi:hypothetical protein
MADMTVKIDGNLTLEQIKDAVEFEQNKGFQLQSIERTTISQGGEALMVNRAEFVFKLNRLKTLLFVELSGDNPEAIKQQRKAEGWTFLCTGPIFVKNTITNVMVFAK